MSRVTRKDLRQAVYERPDDALAARTLGMALKESLEYEAALKYLIKAAELDPTFPNNHYDIMNALTHLGRLEDAAGACRAALELLPLDAQLYRGMGIINEWLGCSAEAVQAYTRAIEIEPDNLDGYAGVCQVCVDGKGPEEGEAIASEITRHTGRPIELLKGMAFALYAHGRYPEARSYWERVLKLVPDDIVALIEAARLELGIRNIEAASSLYDRALALDPTNPTLIWHRVILYIRTGQLDRAMELKRADLDSLRQPAIPPESVLESPQGMAPDWDWAQDLSGKTILVKDLGGDFGFGDFIQLSRFLPLIKERGARVIYQCPPPLHRLFATLPGADEVVAPYEECGPFDYQCLIELAFFNLEWTWDWMARNTPYLFVASEQRSPWIERFRGKGVKIGIDWRAGESYIRDRYSDRSAPLEVFRPLSSLPNVTVFSLQVGHGVEELTHSTGSWIAENLGGEFKDFNDTAAAVTALDAVVTVDTAMAHLAGALGKPCFVALPYYPSARWMSESEIFERNRCLWYPSMHVFRQHQPGDWSPVIREVTEAVHTLLGQKRNAR